MRLSCLLVVAPAIAATDARADETPGHAETRKFGAAFSAYQIDIAMTSAGPLRFTDTPDMTLDPTTVFVIGGRIGFGFGDPRADNHRLGLAVGYESVAHSKDRSLTLVTPQLTYETGHPLMMRIGLGYAVAGGTSDFADNYKGVYTSGTLAWSFLDRGRPGARLSAALGLTAQVIAAGDSDYHSAYIGGDLAFRFHLGKQGGPK